MIQGWTGRSDERRILALLAESRGDSLDVVLRQLNLRHLVRNLHDRVGGADHRSQLLHLLTIDRIDDLSLHTRVALVWALQRGSTRRSFELAIRNVICASVGKELRDLRNRLNQSDSYRDLTRLIFKDIDDEDIRTEILQHIRNHQFPTDELIIFSDIDDTLFARLHDKSYPGKTRYPGVLAFFRVLNAAASAPGERANITFVTARPGLFGGIVAAYTRRSLRAAGIPHASILTGSLLALRSHRSMAARKIANVHQYHQVFPEYRFVFVGDNGQGDVDVGREMLRVFPEDVRGVFIHDIHETALNQPALHHEQGMEFFDTYIAAATAAWQNGIITYQQALEVGVEAIADLRKLALIPPQMRQDRLAEHQRDLEVLRSMHQPDVTAGT